ncbi:transcription factor SPT20 homolog, partial [Chironomus tepperi]|uniref:transcription factor SPT20 homolog n=1 Tax=Chironomus tepperi TaxID=113505 RepID=UPI00391F4CA1
IQTRSQPDPGIPKNPNNQGVTGQHQNIRPQNPPNINKQNIQQAPNYQPQQQQQQNYRPSSGQQPQSQSNYPNQPPGIRPPLVPNIRPLNNQQPQHPQQQSNIRNLPPSHIQSQQGQQQQQQQQQYRPAPPPGAQQGYQQPPRQTFVSQSSLEQQQPPQQQQYRQQPPQRPAVVPEQKIQQQRNPQHQNQPMSHPPTNMMAEINREKTFTTATNNNNNEPHSLSMDDDDDDVVVGRMTTPQSKNGHKPVETYDTRPMSGKENVQPQMRPQPVPQAAPAPQTVPVQQPVPAPVPVPQQVHHQQQADMKRRESVQSIPSRPQSALGSNQSVSPEPRMSPNPPQQQPYRPPSQADSNRQHNDYVRDTNDYDRGQRPMSNVPPPSAHQRQSPEDMHRPKMPPPPVQQQHQPSPPPVQMPSQNIKQQHQQHVQQQQQQNVHRPNQDGHIQPSIQDHLPFMKPNLIAAPAPQKVPEKRIENESVKNVMDEKKKSIDLDLSKNSSMKVGIKDSRSAKGDNDSGVDESTQEKDKNGHSPNSPLKSPSKIPSYQQRPASITPKTRSRSTSKQRLSLKASPEEPPEPLIKKIPMNKIEVGNAPSPNLKKVTSKIRSLENAQHKLGGGQIKIESKKLDFKAGPRIEAKNDTYTPRGGDKKIVSQKLQWNAKSKIGSLENAAHKPGGGDKRIVEIKTDFKEKAKPKVGSKDNLGYVPGGGDIKAREERAKSSIVNQKIDVKAEPKIGSLDNVKHRPGGGDKKIFDDKEYLKNIEHPVPITPPSQMFSSGYYKSKTLNWRSKPYTLTTSLSLPSECIIMSVCSPAKKKRIIAYSGKAFHPIPFRCF